MQRVLGNQARSRSSASRYSDADRHSVNAIGRHAMGARLRQAGFRVDIVPFNELTSGGLNDWMKDIRESLSQE
jgi:hypothetical protein